MSQQVADQLVSALVASEALGALFVALYLAYRLAFPRRRRLATRVCENGHRCLQCGWEEGFEQIFSPFGPEAEQDFDQIDAIFECDEEKER